jgi:hypothetical protein
MGAPIAFPILAPMALPIGSPMRSPICSPICVVRAAMLPPAAFGAGAATGADGPPFPSRPPSTGMLERSGNDGRAGRLPRMPPISGSWSGLAALPVPPPRADPPSAPAPAPSPAPPSPALSVLPGSNPFPPLCPLFPPGCGRICLDTFAYWDLQYWQNNWSARE